MADFVPSRDKLEAVNRISALTHGGPEELGPGSKERKRVLEKVVAFFELPVDVSANKVELGRAVVEALGGAWTSTCYSTGYTITLHGLDLVLELALAEAARRGAIERPVIHAVEDEAARILEACAPRFQRTLDMRSCVAEMRDREDRNWAQSEWPGFYFEGTARAACMAIEGGEPGPRHGSVRFDYRLAHVWDFKAHSLAMADGRANRDAILNAADAVESCIEENGGLGFIVGHGAATYDVDGSLREWMTAQKAAADVRSRSAKSGRRRAFKATFAFRRLDALFFSSVDTLLVGMRDGWLVADFQAGFKQIDGVNERRSKFKINTLAMPAHVVVASREIGE